MGNAVKASYDWCYRVARGSGSSFYRAFWLLDKPQRIAMFALYAFARITDDLGDGHENAPANSPHGWQLDRSIASQVRLAAWSKLLSDKLAESVSRVGHTTHVLPEGMLAAEAELRQFDQLWPALRDTIVRYGIPPSLLQELIDGVAMDGDCVRFATWEELDKYSYRVASTVGLACTRIWQAADTLPKAPPIDCGLAFQLTNILRDLREDAARNRIYLPMSELNRFGCDEDSWLTGQPRGDWPGLVRSAILRARGLYESGKHTIDHLPRAGKRIFGLMWSTYHDLLDAIDRKHTQLWQPERITLSPINRMKLLTRALITTPSSKSLGRG